MKILVVVAGEVNLLPPIRNLTEILLRNNHAVTLIVEDKSGLSNILSKAHNSEVLSSNLTAQSFDLLSRKFILTAVTSSMSFVTSLSRVGLKSPKTTVQKV